MGPLIPFYEVPILDTGLPSPFGDGSLKIHGFGILVALGFILGGNVAMKRAERMGYDGQVINQLITWLVVGTFVGGHFGYGFMYAWDEYSANPWLFLDFRKGLSSFGGFLVCVPLSFWWVWRRKEGRWQYMDSLAIGLSLGWGIGRLGCTVAHDHPGTPSTFWLAKYCRPVEGHTLQLPPFLTDSHGDIRWGPCAETGRAVLDITDTVPATYDGVLAAHDMGFYEALWSLGVFAIFVAMDRFAFKPGVYAALLGVFYGPARFWMDSLRPESTDGRWFMGTALEMTPGQFWSLVVFVVGVWGLVMRLRSDDEPVKPGPWRGLDDLGDDDPEPAGG